MIREQEGGGPGRGGGCSRGDRGIGRRTLSPPSPALYGSSVPEESSFSPGPRLTSSRGTGVDLEGAETRPFQYRSFTYLSHLCFPIGRKWPLRHCHSKARQIGASYISKCSSFILSLTLLSHKHNLTYINE